MHQQGLAAFPTNILGNQTTPPLARVGDSNYAPVRKRIARRNLLIYFKTLGINIFCLVNLLTVYPVGRV